jgi:hypothetical protein
MFFIDVKLHSWDYSWKANRWSGPKEMHTLELSLFQQSKENDQHLKLLYTAQSTQFNVMSSHKTPMSRKRCRVTAASVEIDEVDVGADCSSSAQHVATRATNPSSADGAHVTATRRENGPVTDVTVEAGGKNGGNTNDDKTADDEIDYHQAVTTNGGEWHRGSNGCDEAPPSQNFSILMTAVSSIEKDSIPFSDAKRYRGVDR